MKKITAADCGIVVKTGASAIDTLAALAQTLDMKVWEIATELKVSQATVHAWIADKRRPSGANRLRLIELVRNGRQLHMQGSRRRWSPARDAQFSQLLVALQTPAERAKWLANRAELRTQFAR